MPRLSRSRTPSLTCISTTIRTSRERTIRDGPKAMEKSLDELIEFLLEEIALGGPRGLTLSQIYDSVISFYDEAEQENRASRSPSSPIRPSSASQNVDQTFIYNVWKWLGRHHDVSIGDKKRHNKTPLQQFWPRSENAIATLRSSRKSAPRISVNDDRIYQAICGHPMDSNRIFAREFALLSQIAASGKAGILQGELRRATGQDKRSVPKRTDALRDKGYITKDTVYVKGIRTSHLTLRRYATERQDDRDVCAAYDGPEGYQLPTPITVDSLVNKIENSFVGETRLELDDIAKLLGLTADAQKKVLTKVIRCMERAGCLKRVKMALAPNAQAGDLKTYIQLRRSVTTTDWDVFDKHSIHHSKPVAELVAEEAARSLPATPDAGNVNAEENLAVAQWNPDRCVANMVSDAARVAGPSTLSGVSLRDLITGPFMRRPLESLLTRLSYQGLLNQPDHLRHLAIIRVSKLVEGSLEYTHSSIEALQQAAKDKTAQIALIPGAERLLIPSTQGQVTSIEDESTVQPDLDAFGFRVNHHTRTTVGMDLSSLPNRDQATYASNALRRAGVLPVSDGSHGEEVPEPAESMRAGIKRRTPKRRPRPTVPNVQKPERPQGRPRTFIRGTEKFWQYHFWQARLDARKTESELPAREGTMQDPAAKALFRSRPEYFDETIVEAKAAGLPLPSIAADISKDWIRQTRAVLDRAGNGVYVTPAGVHMGRTRYISQLLVVRSHRLREVDFSEKKKVPSFRFISSSAAHSFAKPVFPPGSSQALRAAPKQARKARQTRIKGSKKITEQAVKPGPRLGIFVEATTSPHAEGPQDQPSYQLPAQLSAVEYQQVMDDTEPDSGFDDPQVSPSTHASSRSSRTSFTTSAAGDRPARLKARTQSINSQASTAFFAAAVRSRPSRQRKLTQKAAEALEAGSAEVNVRLSTAPIPENSNRLKQQDAAVESEPRSGPTGIQGTSPAVLETNDREDGGAAYLPVVAQDPLPLPANPSGQSQESFAIEDVQAENGRMGNKENDEPASDTESLQAVPASLTRSKKRKLSGLAEEIEITPAASAKRPKPAFSSQSANSKLCRKIIVDLVVLASGAAPSDASTITRVMTNRWQVAGGEDRPTLKLVRNNLKSLSESSKLRLIAYSFRGKGGALRKKTILAHPNIDPTGELIQALKKKIVEADPSDYVPPAWQAETLPNLNVSGNKGGSVENAQAERPPIQELPQLFPNQEDVLQEGEDEPETPEVPLTPQTPISKSRRRRSTAVSGGSGRSSGPRGRYSQISRSNDPPTPSPKVSSPATAAFLTLKLKKKAPSPKLKASGKSAFLTLKVPRLAELPQEHIFNANVKAPEWSTGIERLSQDSENQDSTPLYLPAVPLQYNPAGNFQRGTALHTPAAKRRSGLRRKTKGIHFDAITHEIIAEIPRIGLPKSLKSLSAIIESENATHEIEKLGPDAGEGTRFFLESDIIEAWEARCQHAIQASDMKWTFINHSSPDQPRATPIAYWLLVNVSRDGTLTESPSFEKDSWPPFVAAIQETASQDAPSPSSSDQCVQIEKIPTPATPKRSTKEKTGTRRKRKLRDALDFVPSTPKRPKKSHVRPSRAKPVVSQEHDTVAEVITASPQKRLKARKTRASNYMKRLSADDIYRFTITVICVRILTGGIERHVDWSIVRSMIPNELDEELLDDCWAYKLDKHKSDIRSLSETFQEKYIEALELGDVPTIDFHDLHATNWKDVVSWAINALDPAAAASKKVLDLPATRSEFLSMHKISRNDTPSIRSIYQPVRKIDKAGLEDLHKTTVFGTSLQQIPSLDTDSVSAETTCHLRSLWLSLIICPDNRYSAVLGDAKYYSIAPTENEVEILMRPIHEQLQKDQFIAERPGAQKLQGPRKWLVTSNFYERFNEKNCLITAGMLKDAARYKLAAFDELFARGEMVEFPKGSRVGAGEMLAITQLLGMAMIELRPASDIPNSRYGVDWQRVGYQTSRLEKAQFGFGVVIAKRPGYVFGDVVGKRVAVDLPAGDDSDPKATPIWVDVQGEVVHEVWEMVLGSAMGIISMRPGVSAEEISKSLGNAVGAWEVKLLLTWADKAGFIKKTRSGSGWETKEWWWMCLGCGADADEL